MILMIKSYKHAQKKSWSTTDKLIRQRYFSKASQQVNYDYDCADHSEIMVAFTQGHYGHHFFFR